MTVAEFREILSTYLDETTIEVEKWTNTLCVPIITEDKYWIKSRTGNYAPVLVKLIIK